MKFKALKDLDFGERDAVNYRASENKDKFNKFFLQDEKIQSILGSTKYFLIGDKGTGKTAHAIYLEHNPPKNGKTLSSVVSVQDTDYHKFLKLKKNNDLMISDYQDIWKLIMLVLISDKIINSEPKGFWNGKKFSLIETAMDKFYNSAFSPEIKYAIEMAENSVFSAKVFADLATSANAGLGAHAEIGNSKNVVFPETRYQNNIAYITRQFMNALREINLNKEFILFIDGIDSRPENIEYQDYIDCIKGLADAVWKINSSDFITHKKLKKFKVMLLIRPDIFDRLSMHNMNNKLADNSVVINWQTPYPAYRQSGLFKIVDKMLRMQQDDYLAIQEGESWDHYFPFSIYNDVEKTYTHNPFIHFLRYSFYRPRDIIAHLEILNEYIKNNSSDNLTFSSQDIEKSHIKKAYSEYLLGEIKDNLAFYHSSVDFETFRNFFSHLNKYMDNNRNFNYEDYCSAFRLYKNSFTDDKLEIPQAFNNADKFLQLLFELNIICYWEAQSPSGAPYVKWYFKEKTYSNIRPKIETACEYKMHKGIARALGIH